MVKRDEKLLLTGTGQNLTKTSQSIPRRSFDLNRRSSYN